MLPLPSALRAGSDPILAPGELDSVAAGADGRFWFLERLRNILEDHARRAPFVIVPDELQWADAATLAALRFLCPQLASSPVPWVPAHNPDRTPSPAPPR
jgi:predicted ATPase